MKGRRPKAPHLKLIQGNVGHRAKDSRVAPKLPVDIDRPPKWLTKEAKREWRHITPLLKEAGLLTRLDTAQVAQWCTCVARYADAERHLNAEGTMITTPTGFTRPSAWFKVSMNLSAQMLRMAEQYGLTPASRARLKVEAPPPTSAAESAFDVYLKRGRDRSPVPPKIRRNPPPDPDDDTPPAAA